MEQNFDIKKTLLTTMVASLVISALIGIFIFLFGNFSDTETKILLTTLTLGGFSLTGLCCSVLYEKKKYIPFAIFGIVISFFGFLFTTLAIWEFIDIFKGWFDVSEWGRLILVLIILSFSSAHSCLLLLMKPKKPFIRTSLFSTIIFIGIVSLMLIFLVFEIIKDPEDFYFRLLGIFAILNVLGTIVTPIMNKIYSNE